MIAVVKIRLSLVIRFALPKPKPETILQKLEEWDSMGMIAIIAMLDKKYKVRLKADQIKALKTVADILGFMQQP